MFPHSRKVRPLEPCQPRQLVGPWFTCRYRYKRSPVSSRIVTCVFSFFFTRGRALRRRRRCVRSISSVLASRRQSRLVHTFPLTRRRRVARVERT